MAYQLEMSVCLSFSRPRAVSSHDNHIKIHKPSLSLSSSFFLSLTDWLLLAVSSFHLFRVEQTRFERSENRVCLRVCEKALLFFFRHNCLRWGRKFVRAVLAKRGLSLQHIPPFHMLLLGFFKHSCLSRDGNLLEQSSQASFGFFQA